MIWFFWIISIKEFYKIKNNEDYILLRVYGINYDSNIKITDLEDERKLRNLKINHLNKFNENNFNDKNKKILVLKIDR